MRYLTVLIVLLAAAIATPATALELTLYQDLYVINHYDVRQYDESSPDSLTMNNQGGWSIGLEFFGPFANEIGEVRIIANGTKEGISYTHSQTKPWVYPWLGVDYYDFNVFIGNKAMVGVPMEMQAFTKTGQPVVFNLLGGFKSTSLFTTPSVNAAKVPVCEIDDLDIKLNGDFDITFTAPADTRNSQIRVLVFDAKGVGAETQQKFFPPYQIVEKANEITAGKIKVALPAAYTGRTARIEYRVWETDGFMSRGITYFTLP